MVPFRTWIMAYRYFFSGILFLLAGMVAFLLWPSRTTPPPFTKLSQKQLPLDWGQVDTSLLLGQLGWLTGDAGDFTSSGELKQLIETHQPGGLQLTGFSPQVFPHLSAFLQKGITVPLLDGSDAFPLLQTHFNTGQNLPSPGLMASMGDEDIAASWQKLSMVQSHASHLEFRILPTAQLDPEAWNSAGILSFAHLSVGPWPDTSSALNALEVQLRPLIDNGLSGIYLDSTAWEQLSISENTWRVWLREGLGFQGLLLTDFISARHIPAQLNASVDIWMIDRKEISSFNQTIQTEYAYRIRPEEWDARLLRVLKAKEWVFKVRRQQKASTETVKQASLLPSSDPEALSNFDLYRNLEDNRWDHLAWKWTRSSLVLAANPNFLLPFTRIGDKTFQVWTLSDTSCTTFEKRFRQYADVRVRSLDTDRYPIQPIAVRQVPGTVNIVLVDQENLTESTHGAFIRSVRHLASKSPVVVLHFGAIDQLQYWGDEAALIYVAEKTKLTETLAAEMLFGGFSPRGKLPYAINDYFPADHGLTFPKIRLQRPPTQIHRVLPEKLVGIDAIVYSAIEKGAFPGCQIAIAYQGDILYSKAFGKHTYQEDAVPVKVTDLYDLASLTKVAATTMMAMSLHHRGVLDLRKPIGDYLSFPSNSRLAAIPVERLLTHQSGLRSNLPIFPYLKGKKKSRVNCKDGFCDWAHADFPVSVAEDLYFSAELEQDLRQSILALNPRQGRRYRYSDLNFYLLQQILEQQSGQSLDAWTQEHLYRDLGLRYTLFNPLERFSKNRIAPTERDMEWRKQLLQGYVHDEAAALLGGVSGHAGLFSNAEDLAVLFQMVLNGGQYGGTYFFDPGTTTLFTEPYKGEIRGLGFDKPSRLNASSRAGQISQEAYGHTGFTGTCVWVDPANELVFVFLSNRVHPKKDNRKLQEQMIRRRIHDVVYDALGTASDFFPGLPGEKNIQ